MSEPVMKKSQIKIWFLIPLVIFIAVIVMFYLRVGKSTDVEINTSLNKPVPKFELPLLSEPRKNVTNDVLPNKPYLINFWGSWCPTCVIEHPYLVELANQGVTIVGINYKDELDNAYKYLQNNQDPFVFSIFDTQGDLGIDFGLRGAPETFVVDGQGNIRQHIIGEIAEQNWQSVIKPCFSLLEEYSQQGVDTGTQEANTKIAEVCK